jgi:hypothetical protein
MIENRGPTLSAVRTIWYANLRFSTCFAWDRALFCGSTVWSEGSRCLKTSGANASQRLVTMPMSWRHNGDGSKLDTPAIPNSPPTPSSMIALSSGKIA